MTFKLLFSLAVFGLMIFNVNGQSSGRYQGTLYSSDSTLLLKNIDVTNLSSKQSIRSDFDGSFWIDAKPIDTIEFKHPHWETTKLLAMELQDWVFLEKKSIVLEAVVIVGNTKARKIRELEQMKKDYNTKGGLYYSGKPPLYLLIPFGGPYVTFFYEALSKSGKNARRFNKYVQQEIQNMEVDQIFNKLSISEIIPMEEKELEAFMVAYRPKYEEAQYWTTYDLHVYVKKSYKEYKDQNLNSKQ